MNGRDFQASDKLRAEIERDWDRLSNKLRAAKLPFLLAVQTGRHDEKYEMYRSAFGSAALVSAPLLAAFFFVYPEFCQYVVEGARSALALKQKMAAEGGISPDVEQAIDEAISVLIVFGVIKDAIDYAGDMYTLGCELWEKKRMEYEMRNESVQDDTLNLPPELLSFLRDVVSKL